MLITALSILNTGSSFAVYTESPSFKAEVFPVKSTSVSTTEHFKLTAQIREIQTIAQGDSFQIDHIEMPPESVGFCGDGIVGPGEECDDNNFNGKTCNTEGFDKGSLVCNACVIDTSNCSNNQGGGGGGAIIPEDDDEEEDTDEEPEEEIEELEFNPEIIPNLELKIEKEEIKVTIPEEKPQETKPIKEETHNAADEKPEITEIDAGTCEEIDLHNAPEEYNDQCYVCPKVKIENKCCLCIIAIIIGIINFLLLIWHINKKENYTKKLKKLIKKQLK